MGPGLQLPQFDPIWLGDGKLFENVFSPEWIGLSAAAVFMEVAELLETGVLHINAPWLETTY